MRHVLEERDEIDLLLIVAIERRARLRPTIATTGTWSSFAS
jgi:hypothetical protein